MSFEVFNIINITECIPIKTFTEIFLTMDIYKKSSTKRQIRVSDSHKRLNLLMIITLHST